MLEGGEFRAHIVHVLVNIYSSKQGKPCSKQGGHRQVISTDAVRVAISALIGC